MSVEEVQEVYALANHLSSKGCILDRMIKRQAFTRDKRDLLALLEEHLRLQGQTIDPDKVMDRIGIWPGLTPDQHADVYGYCCEFYLDMQTDVVKDLIFDCPWKRAWSRLSSAGYGDPPIRGMI